MAFSPVLDTGDGIQAIVECNEYSLHVILD